MRSGRRNHYHFMATLFVENTIKEIGDELAQKPIYEAGLEQAQTELSAIEETIKGREAELNRIRREKEYKIFEGEPSFFKLSKKEKKDIIDGEIIKVKEFLDKEYIQYKR